MLTKIRAIRKPYSNKSKKIINERLIKSLNKSSSKEETFLEVKNEFELIMKKCGFDDKLKYENS